MKNKVKMSLHKSLLTGKRTQLIINNGHQGSELFREARITYQNGSFSYIITDGYKWLTIEKSGFQNLKSLISIVHGYITPKPWYAWME